jgi:hypothetical protein
MPDSETSAALRSLLEKLRKSVSCSEGDARTNAAAKLFETVGRGQPSLDDLKPAGKQPLQTPTMWR